MQLILEAVTNIHWMFFQGNLELRRYNLWKKLQGSMVVTAKWMIEFFQLFSLQHMPETSNDLHSSATTNDWS